MPCEQIKGNELVLSVYFVTSAISGSGFGDIVVTNEMETVKIVVIAMCFVIFRVRAETTKMLPHPFLIKNNPLLK